MRASNCVFISVDIETAGPNPSDYPLLAIGACLVDQPDISFYVELQPDREKIEPSALAISRLEPDRLRQEGTAPPEAMQVFETWVLEQIPKGSQAIFVAFNAPFDWMFVADYFHRYLGRNPFGYLALDIKALFMGKFGVPWDLTNMDALTRELGITIQLSHNALEDARDQARIFNTILQSRTNHNANEEN